MKIFNFPLISSSLGVIVLMVGLTAWPAVQAQSRYIISTDGSEVTDVKTGLIWRRCSAGQVWSGTLCAGGFSVFTHEAALAYASTQTGWRLPNVKELTSLADTTTFNPIATPLSPSPAAINIAAFPGTANTPYWSSTPDVQQSSSAWSVEFNMGAVSSTPRNTAGVLVRLVR
jgi:hypothetical protein